MKNIRLLDLWTSEDNNQSIVTEILSWKLAELLNKDENLWAENPVEGSSAAIKLCDLPDHMQEMEIEMFLEYLENAFIEVCQKFTTSSLGRHGLFPYIERIEYGSTNLDTAAGEKRRYIIMSLVNEYVPAGTCDMGYLDDD